MRRNKITPRSIKKAIADSISQLAEADEFVSGLTGETSDQYQLHKYIDELEYEMELCARNLQFEKAAVLRDKIKEMKNAFSR